MLFIQGFSVVVLFFIGIIALLGSLEALFKRNDAFYFLTFLSASVASFVGMYNTGINM